MGYSDLYKFIYLRFQKTGGTSIEKFLIENLKNNYVPDRPVHTHCYTFKKKLGDKKFDSYLKFAVTRNPWERIFSLYWILTSC